jgi:hypothetical protein
MPIHDWTRVEAGTYHNFHQDWTIEICRVLNRGVLPEGFFAFADQRVGGPEPDVVALRLRGPGSGGGLAVAESPPRMRSAARAARSDAEIYARKANRIAIKEDVGRVVAIIEVVSPGNKDSRNAVGSFVSKAVDFLRNGIHFLMIDPFPSGPRDPNGLAQLIWDELVDEPLPPRVEGKPLSVTAFDAGDPLTAYADHLAVGDAWPETPLFLEPGWYVNVPLEATYEASWGMMPRPLRELVEPAVPS